MIRLLTALAPASLAALALSISVPAAADTAGAYYVAKLDKPAAQKTLISSEVVWHAHDNVLEAAAAGDIAKRVCAVLARQVGSVTEFSADGKPLSAEDVAYCNEHARKTK